MAEHDDEEWWVDILLPTLEGRPPLTMDSIRTAFSEGRFMVNPSKLDHALTTLQSRGVLKAEVRNNLKYWALANAPPVVTNPTVVTERTPSVEGNVQRRFKDEVVRSLLDLIEKAHRQGDQRIVATLDRAVFMIYSNEQT